MGKEWQVNLKVDLLVRFWGLAQDIVPVLPGEFALPEHNLVDYPTWEEAENTTSARVTVEPHLAQQIIDWGRQQRSGRPMLHSVRCNDVYDLSDIDGLDVVEVYSLYLATITNFRRALEVVWTCQYCTRTSARQTGDLQVVLEKQGEARRSDVQQAENGEWLVTSQVQDVLRDFGLEFRPLKRSTRFAQVVVTQTCAVRSDVHPYQVQDIICPGCGKQAVYRTDVAQLDPFPIYREYPVTIDHCDTQALNLARSNVNPSPIHIAAHPENKIGKPIGSANMSPFYYIGSPVYFASADIVRHLLELGVTGLGFRPAITALV